MTAVFETHVAPTQAGALIAIVDAQVAASEDLVVEELLVEDVSIDGMCGVY